MQKHSLTSREVNYCECLLFLLCRAVVLWNSPVDLCCSYFSRCSQLQPSSNVSCSVCFSVVPTFRLHVLPSSISSDICRMLWSFAGRSTCATGIKLLLWVIYFAFFIYCWALWCRGFGDNVLYIFDVLHYVLHYISVHCISIESVMVGHITSTFYLSCSVSETFIIFQMFSIIEMIHVSFQCHLSALCMCILCYYFVAGLHSGNSIVKLCLVCLVLVLVTFGRSTILVFIQAHLAYVSATAGEEVGSPEWVSRV